MAHVVILGCGYTGRRLARRMLEQGLQVIATTRDPSALDLPGAHIIPLDLLSGSPAIEILTGALILHSIPVLRRGSSEWLLPTPLLLPLLQPAARVVYLSTTGVYGETRIVDHTTPIAPRRIRERLRAEEERDIAAGPWSSLILRPAAIYGPGRGVHVSMRQGRHRLWGNGSNFISRIHVDDLAAIAAAALHSGLTGAYPVADDEPCTAAEISRFCADLLDLPLPLPEAALPDDDTRRADRRVDGSAIRRLLGITLRYPSYRSGIPAALADAAQMNL